MNAIKFGDTRYGYKAVVGGAVWQMRRMADGHTFAVFTEDEAYAERPNFYGDLLDARAYLNGIAADYADVMEAQ